MLIENRPLIFSHGGGRQTVAMGVLAVKGEIEKPSMIIMADTGREATSTWDYHKRYFLPFMEANGMPVHIAPHSLSHCPNRVNSEWKFLRDEYPADFQKACMVDADVRGRSKHKGEFLFLHRSCKPLAECSFANKGDSCGLKDCESGRCFV